MKKTLTLNEEQLHRLLAECVSKVLNEIGDTDKFYNIAGQSAGEATANGDISKAGRACRVQNALARHNGMDPTDDKAILPFSNGFNSGYEKGKKKIAESRIRRIVSECIAQECGGMKGGLEETGGKWGMGSMTGDLDALKNKRDNMSVYDAHYEELCDKIDRMEEMLQRIINAQKGGLQPVAESKKNK